MKKFLLFALCAIASISAFAEPFSKAKFMELVKAKDVTGYCKYAYESEVSSESYMMHMQAHFVYILTYLKKSLTAAEVLKEAEKFKGLDEKEYQIGLGVAYAKAGCVNQAVAIYEKTEQYNIAYWLIQSLKNNKQYDKAYEIANKYNLYRLTFNLALKQKNYAKAWQCGVKALTVTGGLNNPTECTQIINYIFRYKPANVTKEQQIEFLEKLAQMYPIPGTDFAKWKGFMGFVGFKYKALTKKDLF